MDKPMFIETSSFLDDRGVLRFANSFDLKKFGIRRFYIVSNHKQGYVRAFHGHKKETKYLLVIKGSIMVKTIPLNATNGSLDTYFVDAGEILCIPRGYYHGFKDLMADTIIFVFSDKTLEESKNDDYRLPYDNFGKYVWEDNYR